MGQVDAAGWDRKEFNVRLSKRRRAQLASWAGPADSPTEALDKALAAAAAAREDHDDHAGLGKRLDDIEDALDAHASERRAEAASLAGELSGLRKSLEALRLALEELARDELEGF